MNDERSFKNDLSLYQGAEDTLMVDTQGKLVKSVSSNLLKAVQTLLQEFETKVEDDGKDGSVYTGTAGIALLYFHLSNKLDSGEKQLYLSKASDWLNLSLKRLKGSRVSFLCGDAGPLAIGAALAKQVGDTKRQNDLISQLERLCVRVCQDSELPDELLYGRCGYLSALLFVQKHCGMDAIKPECIVQVVEVVIKSGESLSRQQKCSHPLMYEWHDKAFLGAAHGLAGIYFTLLQIKEESVQEAIHQKVRPCIDYMLSLQYASGNCPSSIGSSGDKLIHWCHGAPGWIHMFALAYTTYKDPRYLQAARDCCDVTWKRGLLRKGYGLCHGTAGNAYAFLTLHKLTGEQKYLHYAIKFSEWCSDYGKHGCRTPDRPYSLFEGMAGTIYFLTDLMQPSSSAFPAFEFWV